MRCHLNWLGDHWHKGITLLRQRLASLPGCIDLSAPEEIDNYKSAVPKETPLALQSGLLLGIIQGRNQVFIDLIESTMRIPMQTKKCSLCMQTGLWLTINLSLSLSIV